MTNILPDLSADARIAKLEAALAAATAALAASSAPKALTLKVSEKGALSLYGMGQWPVTLYKSQWLRLIDMVPTISEFIATHQAVLAEKPAK